MPLSMVTMINLFNTQQSMIPSIDFKTKVD